MPLLAIPNVSEGRSEASVEPFVTAAGASARVLDVHTDAIHNRSVLTVTAAVEGLVAAMVELAVACSTIDLTSHEGVHPRLGGLDVCPFVPHLSPMSEAIRAARMAGDEIAHRTEQPVFFYGDAALRKESRDLPEIRRGGLEGLNTRIAAGLVPDVGPRRVDPRRGVVCVGARAPLIAFNVELESDARTAKEIAAQVRDDSVRALGFALGERRSQVSMNLIAPDVVGIDSAFARVDKAVESRGTNIAATEIVGLVPARFLPDPDAKAARLLIEPGRSLEAALGD